MPPSLFLLLGLAALLLIAVLRFVRPRSSWSAFHAGALVRAERTRRETERATEAISSAEALLPLRALLREPIVPSGVELHELDAGAEEVRVLVTSPQASLMLRLTHSPYRRADHFPAPPAGLWLLSIRDAVDAAPRPEASSPDAEYMEETFDDLAACAARLQTLVADPSSARRSLHAPSD